MGPLLPVTDIAGIAKARARNADTEGDIREADDKSAAVCVSPVRLNVMGWV